ncbi:cytochrome b5-like heme/steroid binding domain-containing protein [Gongronella butleri]|nr:cytochrome b5-like heme/steroid binding domain-containing protein [Gongronella butleri]
MNTTFNTLLSQVKENPLNWALIAVLAYIAKSYVQSSAPAKLEAKHPAVLLFKNYTPVDLLPFDGLHKEHDKRILMAVNGSVYDVTKGASFYGPEGPYANFAGHDASRGLAKHSFDKDMVADPAGPIDKLEDLTADEWEALREWEQHFATKYLLVGKLVENETEQR